MPFEIVKSERLAPEIFLMDIDASRVAKKAMPGQFVIMRLDERGERIPLTMADFDRANGTITIVFQAVGKTTAQLSLMKRGDEILDFIGPLGNPAHIQKEGTVMLVAGGMGVAPIFPQARAFSEAGNRVISVLGARTSGLMIWEDRMDEFSDELHIATDDGSRGHHGFVTDVVKKILADGTKVDRTVAIGPPVMMRAVADATRAYNVKTVASLNSIMMDGTGMCGACRVLVGNETKFACVDGPEFDAHLVDFNLLISRLKMYKPEEKVSAERYKCGREGCVC